MKAVLDRIRRTDIVSVAGLSESIGLSKTTLKKIIDALVARSLVVSAGKGESTEEGGKKPELFRFNRSFGYIISLHVTPDAVLAATTDMNADITCFRTTPVGDQRDLASILRQLARSIREFMSLKAGSAEQLIGIAVSLPGLADPPGGVSIYSPHYPSWGRNIPFTEMLCRELDADCRVPIMVDCVNRYQAIAEREKGIANGAMNFIIVDALDEGLGSGIVLHGELLRGSQSISGEIGHMTVNPVDGALCICGNRGCFEAMVSAGRVLAMAREALARGVDSILFRRHDPAELGLEDVCLAAAAGDPLAVSLIDDVARWFIVGLGNIIMVNDPELIIIQGRYVSAGQMFLARLREGIRRIGLPDVEKRVRIEYSNLGEERGVIGGASFLLADWFARRLVFQRQPA